MGYNYYTTGPNESQYRKEWAFFWNGLASKLMEDIPGLEVKNQALQQHYLQQVQELNPLRQSVSTMNLKLTNNII